MVHALVKVKQVLKPGAPILVVHDTVDSPRITVQYLDQSRYAGLLNSDTSFENQRLADQAIDQLVQQGIFSASNFRIFENDIRADSLADFTEWLADSWESAYLPPGTREKIAELVENWGSEAEIVLHMISRIIQLDPAG
jgi:ribonucleotide reductase alpha subunit